MIVRAANREDAETMARVHWLSSNTAYGRDDPFERRLAAAHRLFEEEGVRPYLAEEDGAVVGVLTVGEDELYALYVHPGRWGTGAGQALIDQAHELLSATCDTATLTVLTSNGRARRFYERNGWELVERLTEIHFGGEPTDVCRYRKRFSSARSSS